MSFYRTTSKARLGIAFLIALAVLALQNGQLAAQQNPFQAQGQNNAQGIGTPTQGVTTNGFGGPLGNPQGNIGGGPNADFDTLIDLIQSTVSVESWAENGGGDADIRPFTGGGVLVDPSGTLQLVKFASSKVDLGLPTEVPAEELALGDPRRLSEMRYVSLPRLERELARLQAASEPLEEAMLTLAGLRRVDFVIAYPESGDLVLAGPADDWYADGEKLLSRSDDHPVVRLDDLLLLWRRERSSPGSFFGCSIKPRQDRLAKTQEYLDESSGSEIKPCDVEEWLEQLRATLDQQDIEIFGIESNSRVARVLVHADYHMKLIGMGLEEGVVGVKSYLDTVRLRNGKVPPLSVLRWWFAMKYRGVKTDSEREIYQFLGPAVRVQSEDEFLNQQGERQHTGKSDYLTALFSHSFTKHFAALCERYPLYGELKNIFDLALVAALIEKEGLADRAAWQPTLLLSAKQLALPEYAVPRQVDSVANHRVIADRHIVAGVSGGVLVAPGDVLEKPYRRQQTDELTYRKQEIPTSINAGRWWWDAGE